MTKTSQWWAEYRKSILIGSSLLLIGFTAGQFWDIIKVPAEIQRLNEKLIEVETKQKKQEEVNENLYEQINSIQDALIKYEANQAYIVEKLDKIDQNQEKASKEFREFVSGYYKLVPKN